MYFVIVVMPQTAPVIISDFPNRFNIKIKSGIAPVKNELRWLAFYRPKNRCNTVATSRRETSNKVNGPFVFNNLNDRFAKKFDKLHATI